jgi:hypothetical protein
MCLLGSASETANLLYYCHPSELFFVFVTLEINVLILNCLPVSSAVAFICNCAPQGSGKKIVSYFLDLSKEEKYNFTKGWG